MPAPVAGVDGAWECSACRNVNFASREACNRCHAANPGRSTGTPARGSAQAGGGWPVPGVNGAWACGLCGNTNYATRTACNRCAALRTPGDGAAMSAQSMQLVGGVGGMGGVPVAPAGATLGGPMPLPLGGMVPMAMPFSDASGNWACTACGNINVPFRGVCNRCGSVWQPTAFQPCQPASYPVAGGSGDGSPPQVGVGGNWACPSCGNTNYGSRVACNRCAQPRPGDAAIHNKVHVGGAGPQAGVNGNWACVACGNINFPSRTACHRCSQPRRGGTAAFARPSSNAHAKGAKGSGSKGSSGAPQAGVDGNWACAQCHNVNVAVRVACNRCGAPMPPKASTHQGAGTRGGTPVAGVGGNWACPLCSNVNYPHRDVCNRCQGPKPPEVGVGPSQQFNAKRASGAGGSRDPLVPGVNGAWQCASCQNVNYAQREACNRCRRPKPSGVAQDQAEGEAVEVQMLREQG